MSMSLSYMRWLFNHKHHMNVIQSSSLEWELQTETQQSSSKKTMCLLRHVLLASWSVISLLALSGLQPCVTVWDWFMWFVLLCYLKERPGQEAEVGQVTPSRRNRTVSGKRRGDACETGQEGGEKGKLPRAGRPGHGIGHHGHGKKVSRYRINVVSPQDSDKQHRGHQHVCF